LRTLIKQEYRLAIQCNPATVEGNLRGSGGLGPAVLAAEPVFAASPCPALFARRHRASVRAPSWVSISVSIAAPRDGSDGG